MSRVSGFAVLGALAFACNVYEPSLLRGAAGLGEGGVVGSSTPPSAGASTAGTPADPVGTGGAVGGTGGQSSISGSGGVVEPVGTAGTDAASGGDPSIDPGPPPTGAGSITYTRWNGIVGWDVGLVPLAEPPDEQTELDSFRTPGGGDSYAARVLGLLTAPLTGAYRFFIACDNNCELWLSINQQESKLKKIAYVAGSSNWTDVDDWYHWPGQESVPITLTAGSRYRIDARLKQETGGSHLSVAWVRPDQAATDAPIVIPGTQLTALP